MFTRSLIVAGLLAAGLTVPAGSAAAVCIDAYYRVTGDCSPCNTVGRVYRELPTAVTEPLDPYTNCAA